MANPVIDAINPPGPQTLTPGQSVVFTVTAHDPDSKSGTATFTVADEAGNTSQVTAQITVSDPLTFSALTTVGTIVQDAANPAKFTLTV